MARRFLSTVLLLAVMLSVSPTASVRASAVFQDDPAAARALQMLGQMTPEERVGQLFLVAFTGPTADENSQIYDLVIHHHVGGVVLSAAENDNFVAAPDTVSSAYQLIAQLQQAEWQASQNTPTVATGAGTPTPLPVATSVPAQYIPLFVGISQEGDGYPNDQILSGLTPLPDLMAIGATWDPTLAEQVGSVAGQELSSLGFNFYIGPSLDVLESPESTVGNGLDAGVFGGDPYWVGIMGSAYITGLHTGSNGRMVVIAGHFPGRGSADRPAGQEAATVRKSLEQLKQIELAPFFAVTGNAQTPQSTADGLLVAHIRYQGLQGNIRSTTRPVSFDPQALSQILSLPAFSTWHEAGGLMVSDDLGSQTVRNFYDPGGQSFSAQLVARDAFLAGNDLLYMGNIVSSGVADNYTTVVQTMDFFTQKYQEDSAFAKRVDDAVVRILTAKFRLYGTFYPGLVVPQESGLALLDQSQSQAKMFDVARQSATLVNPDTTLDLETVLPSPPSVSDHIVFLTDTRPGRQCSTCTEEPMLAKDALQSVILRLYGLQSGGQVMGGRLVSYSLDSVAGILNGGTGNQDLEDSLKQANWVVINMLDAEPEQPQTTLLRRFLSEQQDLLRDKHVIVFSFNAPYFLDATDISKITAYYCLYSKSAPFVEVAARLLFRELSPAGTLPVSVAGIGYDLLSATAPDPNQVISLSLNLPSAPTPTGSQAPELTPTGPQTPEATPTLNLRVGDTVSVQTGVILDHNGHPVPDGTEVQFTIAVPGSGGVVQQIDAATIQGIAGAPFNIDRPGLLEIRATSDPAVKSVVLQLNVSNEGFSVTVVTPTEINEPTATPTVIATPGTAESPPQEKGYLGFGSWFVMVLILGGFGYLAYWLGDRFATTPWGVRWAICVVLGGSLAYTYLALRLPGATTYLQSTGWLGIIGLVLLGVVVGSGSAYAWFRLARESKRRLN
jgi:beta-N-acetylhexosaminidase